jgi:two-component system, OmpR family, phosphate regulon sensor histidine kinase PhoR
MFDAPCDLLAAVPNEPPLVWIALALLFGLAAGAAMVMVWVVRRRWVAPVQTLARAANDMAGGEWDTRVTVDGPADIELLGRRLNSLGDEVQTRFKALREQTANLKSLVDALPDPVLLVDEQDRILLINAPAERLLQLPPQQVIGKLFLTAVSDPFILDLFETSRRQREAGTFRALDRELRLVRRGLRLSFQAHAEPTENGGLLIVLRDVSTLAATIQMKTDFVANASHELRTPISAIKVAFETLRDVLQPDDNPLTGRCITIIDGHLRRLEEMLRDLLDLSRVENADLKPNLGTVRSADLLEMLRSTWVPIAREKGVDLELPEPPDSIEFTADRRLLDLILKNLVENAIKFTASGGRVIVSFERREKDGRGVLLSVSDTGCGIPEEHKERVFERFYQVDSARSGSAGRGTGLGLAIVKHAVHAMAGQIHLQSKVGAGTTITCVFPPLESAGVSADEP